MLNVIVLSVAFFYCYAECYAEFCYAECRYAECRGNVLTTKYFWNWTNLGGKWGL